jgi:tRNA threonylcarbamoyladenosine biosynthesis protein TsaB
MSVILGIDTSSTDLSIGLYRDKEPLASYSRFVGHSHAEHIAPIVRMMLATNDIKPGMVDRIAIAIGPGSFTGLRIGIAFAKGFCIASPAKVLPLSSLFILAHAACHHGNRIIAAIDARNNDVFRASFAWHGDRPDRLSEDIVSDGAAFIAGISPDDVVVTDTIGYKKSTVFSTLHDRRSVLAVENFPLQRGLYCAAAGAATLDDTTCWREAAELHPNYLRRSAPEERRLKAVPV